MRLDAPTLRLVFSSILCLFLPVLSYGQVGGAGGAPPSIQFFMPDGSLPPRELRFTMSADNGRIETYYTDSKGKFFLSRVLGLRTDAEYKITVESDGRSFDTT